MDTIQALPFRLGLLHTALLVALIADLVAILVTRSPHAAIAGVVILVGLVAAEADAIIKHRRSYRWEVRITPDGHLTTRVGQSGPVNFTIRLRQVIDADLGTAHFSHTPGQLNGPNHAIEVLHLSVSDTLPGVPIPTSMIKPGTPLLAALRTHLIGSATLNPSRCGNAARYVL